MNARLLVALALPLLFIVPGLPESRLSADHNDSTNAADGTQGPAVVSTIAFTSTRDNHGASWAVPPIVGGEIYFIDYLDDAVAGRQRKARLRQQSAPRLRRAGQHVGSVRDES